jgi:polyisoprenoid-binding protein YceI
MVKKFLAIMLAVASFTAATTAADFGVDKSHAYVNFEVDHLGIAPNWGRFNDIDGSFSFDEGSVGSASFEIKIMAASIDTANDRRDKHLRSPDFFNANQFPEITFKSTKVEKKGDKIHVHGDLTMLGTTKQVTFEMKSTGSGQDPWGKFRQGFMGTATIKRSDFGMNYGLAEGTIGDDVKLHVAIEGIRK